MVVGFDKFREHFRGFTDNYIIIGGSACDWLMSHVGAELRATHDIDLIICAENMTPEFGRRVWAFIKAGGYEVYERNDGHRCLFRFMHPTTSGYPSQLEFFAREPLLFPLSQPTTLTPIPIGDDVSSLSGILLEEDYYAFVKSLRRNVDDVCILSAEALLVLKAHAWMNLTAMKANGVFVKDKDLRKHRLDVIRLAAIIAADAPVPLSGRVRSDFVAFMEAFKGMPTDPSSLGIDVSFGEILDKIREIYLQPASAHVT